jgi:uncharacterized protein YukE
MATYTFPADLFTVEGDPEGVRESGRAYGRFASVAGEAAASLGGLDSGGWVGSEGDLFRARVAELPPHLGTACTAFGQVSRALDDFAEVLASAQRQMAGARDQAQQTFGSLTGARADQAGLPQPTDAEAADLDARIGRLETAWDEQLAVAAGIRAQVLEAARRGAAAIRADWAPARADRRGTALRVGRPCRDRSALTSEASRTASGAGAADAARS